MLNREHTIILAVDPGSEFVGWSKAEGHPVSTDYGVEGPYLFCDKFTSRSIDVDRVVIERFDIRQFTNESQLTVEVIGIIKWLCFNRNIPVGFVTPSSKRKFLEHVKQHGLRSHAADAEAIRMWDLSYGVW